MNKEQFKKDALLIWGGIPLDIEWAVNTIVYKEFKNKSL